MYKACNSEYKILLSTASPFLLVKFNDKSEQLPNKLLPKIKGKQKNDSIILSIVNGKIIDVLS